MISVLSAKWTRREQGHLLCSAASWGESRPTSLQSSTAIGARCRGYHLRHLVGLQYNLARAPPLPGIICSINSNLGERGGHPHPQVHVSVPWGGSGPTGSPIGTSLGSIPVVEILHDENKQKYLQQQLRARDKARPQHSAASTVPRSHLRGVAESPKDLAPSQWTTTVVPLVTTPRAAAICARFLSKPPPSAYLQRSRTGATVNGTQ